MEWDQTMEDFEIQAVATRLDSVIDLVDDSSSSPISLSTSFHRLGVLEYISLTLAWSLASDCASLPALGLPCFCHHLRKSEPLLRRAAHGAECPQKQWETKLPQLEAEPPGSQTSAATETLTNNKWLWFKPCVLECSALLHYCGNTNRYTVFSRKNHNVEKINPVYPRDYIYIY